MRSRGLSVDCGGAIGGTGRRRAARSEDSLSVHASFQAQQLLGALQGERRCEARGQDRSDEEREGVEERLARVLAPVDPGAVVKGIEAAEALAPNRRPAAVRVEVDRLHREHT